MRASRFRPRGGRAQYADARSTSRFYHRFGWDGAHVSLGSQSIRPLLEAREMHSLGTRRVDACAATRSVRRPRPDDEEVRGRRRQRRSPHTRRRWSAAARRSTNFATPWRRGEAQPRYPARRSAAALFVAECSALPFRAGFPSGAISRAFACRACAMSRSPRLICTMETAKLRSERQRSPAGAEHGERIGRFLRSLRVTRPCGPDRTRSRERGLRLCARRF